jgi:hypothetical protein
MKAGWSGDRFFPLIQYPAFPERRIQDTEWRVPGILYLLRCYNNEIDRPGYSPHPLVDPAGNFPCIVPDGLDDEEIEIAVRTRSAPCGGAEQEHLFRLCNLYDPADDLIELGIADRGDLVHRITRDADDPLYLRDDIIGFSFNPDQVGNGWSSQICKKNQIRFPG